VFNSKFKFHNYLFGFCQVEKINPFIKNNKIIPLFNEKFNVADNAFSYYNVDGFEFKNMPINRLTTQSKTYIVHGDLIDNNRDVKRAFGVNKPLKILKHNVGSAGMDLFKLRFETNFDTIKQKNKLHSTYLTFKQKRYKKRKFILPVVNSTNGVGMNLFLDDSGFITDLKNKNANTTTYNLIKKNKIRTQQTNILLSKRLLRVKKTLVLPAHVNITAITNSYDVIHS
jgi:hypothetical protein